MHDVEARWGEASIAYDPVLLSKFQARPTDVFVNTAPKAGTTWMTQILHQLRTGGDESFESIYDVVPWIEFPGRPVRPTEGRLAQYESTASPRLFKAHLPYARTPGVGVAKFIVVGRDPRDRCVSAYHHTCDMTDDFLAWLGAERPESFDVYFDEWAARPRYNEHVRSWWEHKDDENVLWLRFADMKDDLEASVRSIVRFLGWDVSEQAIQRTLELASFDWMAAHRDKFTRFSAKSPVRWLPHGFVRTGEVGSYKAALSPAQERRILDDSANTLTPECLAFLGIE